MSDEHEAQTRRGFLKGILFGSGAAAVAIASGRATAAPQARGGPAATPQAEVRGYQETPHVQDYYKTARL